MAESSIIKALTDENAELSEIICSWSRNCGQLSDQISKLKVQNKKLTADNAELQSKLDKNIVQTQGQSKDIKYLVESLEKTTQQNKDLRAESAMLTMTLSGWKLAKPVHDKNTMTEDQGTALGEKIREKDELIMFYKETLDAKVTEVNELQQINRYLRSTVHRYNFP